MKRENVKGTECGAAECTGSAWRDGSTAVRLGADAVCGALMNLGDGIKAVEVEIAFGNQWNDEDLTAETIRRSLGLL